MRETRLKATGLIGIDRVELIGDLARLMFGQELSHSRGKELTAREAKSFGQRVGRMKEIVRE